MVSNKPLIRIFCTGLCLFLACTSINADVKENSKNLESTKLNIVEEKTGISTKNKSVLGSLYNETIDWLKTPYRLGGMSHRGIDCSGLVSTIYQNVFEIKLHRRSKDMSRIDISDLSKSELKPGDLVFFATSRRRKGINHVGLYLGNNHFVHASSSRGVIISNLNERYYQRTWVKGGRVKANSKIFEDLFTEQENLYVKKLTIEPFLIDNVSPTHTIQDI